MNLQHLKYVIEVARTGSMTQAAKNLFVAQSNLSSAVKSLEAELGITIFERTQHGTVPTPAGLRFLNLARPIVYQMSYLESEYLNPQKYAAQVTLSSVRTATFTAYAVRSVVSRLPAEQRAIVRYNEGSAMEVIDDVFSGRFSFGVVKYFSMFTKYYLEILNTKGLSHELLFEGDVHILMSKDHPLAGQDLITPEELKPYNEAGIGENESQLIPYSVQREKAGVYEGNKVLYTYDRATLFQMLSGCTGAYMWISRVHPDLLERFGLVLKNCAFSQGVLQEQEIIVYPADKPLGVLDKAIIQQLKQEVNL